MRPEAFPRGDNVRDESLDVRGRVTNGVTRLDELFSSGDFRDENALFPDDSRYERESV